MQQKFCFKKQNSTQQIIPVLLIYDHLSFQFLF